MSKYQILLKDKEGNDLMPKTNVESIIDLEGKIVTKEMAKSLWQMLKICAYITNDTDDKISNFKTTWKLNSVGTIVYIDDTFQTIKIIDKEDYDDMYVSSSDLEGMTIYFIYLEESEFQFYIYVDGVKTYLVNNIGDGLQDQKIDDDFISFMQSEDINAGESVITELTKYKGQYIVDAHEPILIGGFSYNNVIYYKDGGSEYNDILEYNTEDKTSSIWIQASINDLIENGTYNVGDEISVKEYNYDTDTMSAPEYVGDITITIVQKYK